MKRTMIAVSLAVVSAACCRRNCDRRSLAAAGRAAAWIVGSARAREGHADQQPARIRYETIRNWGTLPDGRKWGSVSAVHVDADGKHIWAGDRCGANVVRRIECRSDGQARSERQGRAELRRGTDPLAARHGRRSSQGNIWVADARSATPQEISEVSRVRRARGHTVMKFQPARQAAADARHAWRSGRSTGEASPSRMTCSLRPTAASSSANRTARSSSIRIAARTASAASRSSRPTASSSRAGASYGYGPAQFRGPHSLAMDSRGRLFVADRGNRRIQIFDQEGKHLDTWYQFSRISGLYIDRERHALRDRLGIGRQLQPRLAQGPARRQRRAPAKSGTSCPSTSRRMPSGMGGYGSMGEGVAVDAAGNVYGGGRVRSRG